MFQAGRGCWAGSTCSRVVSSWGRCVWCVAWRATTTPPTSSVPVSCPLRSTPPSTSWRTRWRWRRNRAATVPWAHPKTPPAPTSSSSPHPRWRRYGVFVHPCQRGVYSSPCLCLPTYLTYPHQLTLYILSSLSILTNLPYISSPTYLVYPYQLIFSMLTNLPCISSPTYLEYPYQFTLCILTNLPSISSPTHRAYPFQSVWYINLLYYPFSVLYLFYVNRCSIFLKQICQLVFRGPNVCMFWIAK